MKRLLVILLLLACQAFAQQEMEVVPLQHRTLEQLLPVLTPFVEPDGVISGMNGQLIIRASPKNIEEIKALLAKLDTPAKRLKITVSNDIAGELASENASVSGQVIIGEHNEARIHGEWSESGGVGRRHIKQSLQVLEGSSGYIVVGQSLPIALHQVVLNPNGAVITDTLEYHDIGSGFYATPQLNGDNVTLHISPQMESLIRGTQGAVGIQRLSTTVTGKLGEWIELGGTNSDGNIRRSEIASYSTANASESRSVWLKVEEVR